MVCEHIPNAYLLLVGLPPSLVHAVNTLPQNVQKNVRMIPFLSGDDALRQCYSALDVFLHVSDIGESFGMVLAEAMLCRCPIVTLRTPLKDNSQVEVVGHGIGGIVASSTASMTEAVVRLLRDDVLSSSVKNKARESITNRFDSDIVMKKLYCVLFHLKNSSGGEDLRRRLANESRLVTNVTTREIYELIAETGGQLSIHDRIVMGLIHQPQIYRAWSSYRRNLS